MKFTLELLAFLTLFFGGIYLVGLASTFESSAKPELIGQGSTHYMNTVHQWNI